MVKVIQTLQAFALGISGSVSKPLRVGRRRIVHYVHLIFSTRETLFNPSSVPFLELGVQCRMQSIADTCSYLKGLFSPTNAGIDLNDSLRLHFRKYAAENLFGSLQQARPVYR